MAERKMVTIQRATYEDLLRRSRELAALDAFGVDNWGGYSDAMQSLEEDDE
jgi:uncharacterized protein involved in exopolysaccharide biosynthesis